jgi:polyisoprenoid-binding protein YceI
MTHLTPRRIAAALALLASLPAFAADTYKIDPVHSSVGFRVTHLLVTKVNGRFTKFSGAITVDQANLAKSSVDVAIETDSIRTDNDTRDNHLRTPDFFDAAKYPAITFKSTSVKQVAPDQLDVTGTLTIKGVSKTVVVPVKNWITAPGMAPNSMNAGLEATLKIDRSEFNVGISKFDAVISKDVELNLTVEANKL